MLGILSQADKLPSPHTIGVLSVSSLEGRFHLSLLFLSQAVCAAVQVPDEELVERVTGRRLDPVTNTIYHLKFKPPPDSVVKRLIQRSDDTEDKLRNRLDTHHKNVEAVIGYYKDILVEVSTQCSQHSSVKADSWCWAVHDPILKHLSYQTTSSHPITSSICVVSSHTHQHGNASTSMQGARAPHIGK